MPDRSPAHRARSAARASPRRQRCLRSSPDRSRSVPSSALTSRISTCASPRSSDTFASRFASCAHFIRPAPCRRHLCVAGSGVGWAAMPSRRPAPTRRPPLWSPRTSALGAVLGLALLYWLHAALAPDSLGVWQDDAIYVSTAQALAEGQGYRHIELPDAPLQTKYPVLYPALLAPLVAIGGGIGAALFVPTALGAALLVALCGLYQRRVLGESSRTTLTLCALAALSPALFDFVRYAMSELVYAPLAVGALVCLDTDASDQASARRRQIA